MADSLLVGQALLPVLQNIPAGITIVCKHALWQIDNSYGVGKNRNILLRSIGGGFSCRMALRA